MTFTPESRITGKRDPQLVTSYLGVPGETVYPFAVEEPKGQTPTGQAVPDPRVTDRKILDAITQINDLLLAPQGHQRLFTQVAQAIARTFGYPFVAVVLFDAEVRYADLVGMNRESVSGDRGREETRKHVLLGTTTRKLDLKLLSDTRWLQAARDGVVYVTPNAHEIATPFIEARRVRALVRLLQIRSGMVVPLIARGQMVGALFIGSNRFEPAPGEQSDLLFLAQHTAVALQMWNLYDRAEGRTALLNKLHTLSQTITSILDLDALYSEVASAAGQLARIDFCSVNTLTPDKKWYKNHAAWGIGPRAEIVGGLRSTDIFPPDMVERGLQGDILLISDVSSFPQAEERLSHRRAHSLAIFPFRCHGDAVGFLTVGRDVPGEWDEDDVQVLKQLSEYVTVAYTNAQLYGQAKRRAERMATLHNTVEQLVKIHKLELLFSALREAVQNTVDAPIFELSLWHGDRNEREIVLDVVDGAEMEPRVVKEWGDSPAEQAIAAADTFHLPLTTDAEGTLEDEVLDTRYSVLAVPLLSGNRPIGAITIKSHKPYAYDEDDVQTMKVLAAQGAASLENIRLLQTEAQRAAEQAALARSIRMIARADMDTDTVLQTIVEAASTLTMGSLCSIMLPDNTGGLVCVASYGEGAELLRDLRVQDGLAWNAFTSGHPLLVADMRTRSELARPDLVEKLGTQSLMAVLLRTERERVGVLMASKPTPDSYSIYHLWLLTTLADHATIALENGKLVREARLKAAEQEAIAESARAITRLDIEDVLQTIVAKASEIVKSARCTLMLHDKKSNELYWAAGHDSADALKALRVPADAGIVGEIFATGEPAIVSNMLEDPRIVRRDVAEETSARSFIGVPLKDQEGNLGVLVMTHKEEGVFTQHDQEVLTTFADHATVALANAHLYKSLQQREAERTTLLHQLLASQEAERRRVGVDIHDGPLQSIGVNLLALDRVRKHLGAKRVEQAVEEITQVRQNMAAVVQELRNVISDLRPALLETQGFVVAARAHLKGFGEQYEIEGFLHDDLGGERMPSTVEVIFYRLLQETLTNVRKHADATEVRVHLWVEGDTYRLSITDNGKGFNPESVVSSAVTKGHIGLHSMWERLDVIGGGMHVDSEPGKGARITFWAPSKGQAVVGGGQ